MHSANNLYISDEVLVLVKSSSLKVIYTLTFNMILWGRGRENQSELSSPTNNMPFSFPFLIYLLMVFSETPNSLLASTIDM
jgi:hypothetical protein